MLFLPLSLRCVFTILSPGCKNNAVIWNVEGKQCQNQLGTIAVLQCSVNPPSVSMHAIGDKAHCMTHLHKHISNFTLLLYNEF